MLLRNIALAGLLVCTGGLGLAQALEEPADKARELPAPPPPAFSTKGLLEIELTRSSGLTFGVDPATISLSPDGVVRYVVIATSPSGATNVMYEGIRCTTAEFRVYARHYPKTGWTNVSSQDWRSLYATNQSRHTLAIARGGACDAAAPRMTVAEIIRALRDTPIKNYE